MISPGEATLPTNSIASLRAFACPIMSSTSKSTAMWRDSSLLIFSKTWWQTGSCTSSSRNFSSAPSRATSSIGMTVPSTDSGMSSAYVSSHSIASRMLTFGSGSSSPSIMPQRLHQGELGVGVPLLLGVEVPVDLGERRRRRLLGHRGEAAGADVLDPAQVGHERLQLGPELVADRLGAGGVPVDVGQRPLPVLDLGQHLVHVHRHVRRPSARVLGRSSRGAIRERPTVRAGRRRGCRCAGACRLIRQRGLGVELRHRRRAPPRSWVSRRGAGDPRRGHARSAASAVLGQRRSTRPVIRPSSRMLVLTKVGHSTLTCTPGAGRARRPASRDSASTPALLTLYGAIRGAAPKLGGRRDVDDAAADPASRSIGAKTWQPWMTPHRLMPSVHCQSSSGVSPMTLAAGADAGVVDHQRRRRRRTSRCASPARACDVVELTTTSQRSAIALPPWSTIASTVRCARDLVDVADTRRCRRGGRARPRTPARCRCPAPVTTARASRLRRRPDAGHAVLRSSAAGRMRRRCVGQGGLRATRGEEPGGAAQGLVGLGQQRVASPGRRASARATPPARTACPRR